MIFLYSGLALIFIVLAYMRFETTLLTVKKVYLTKSSSQLKVIQISDVHIRFLKVNINKITRAIEEQQPDLIILTGDYIDNVKEIPLFLNFLEKVKGTHKTLLCFGNHDYEVFYKNEEGLVKFISDIEKLGIKVLLNDSIYYEKGSSTYNIIGIEDFRSDRHNIEMAFKHCKNNVTSNIAFSHNPDIALELPEGKVDFLLCGHFHGGQIWMPFNFEFRFLRHERLGKMGIKRGLNSINNMKIYISSGIGNVLFPFRFLSPPEITVLYFP